MARVSRFVMGLAAFVAIAAFPVGLHAQQGTGTIRGQVVDAERLAPLPDVTISVADQTVLTGSGGFFVVTDVPSGVYTLRANYIGHRPVEQQVTVTAGGEANVQVRMTIAPFELDPVVAIGYGEAQTEDLTGVVTEVSKEAFNTGRVVSPEELIQAKVAGVQVTENNGGEPGGGFSLRIRGGTSVTASNEPLYVIDGVPLDVGGGLSSGRNPLNFLNPDDIASFTVLKDASSTAIYGSRGANGVVLIETTSGRRAAADRGVSVNYRGNFSGSTPVAGPDIMNAQEFRAAVSAQTPEKLDLLANETTDWRDAVEQNAFGQEHMVAVAGGGDKMDFRVSLGFLNQDGVVKPAGTQRVSLNVGYNQLLFNDRLRLTASVLGARMEDTYTPGGVLGNSTNFAPTQPIYDPDSFYGGYFEWSDPLAANNPVGELNLVTDKGVAYRSVGSVTGEYFLPWLEGLSVTERLGYDVVNSDRAFFAPSTNRGLAETGIDGRVSRGTPTQFSYLTDTYLTFKHVFEEVTLTATGGYSYQQWRYDDTSWRAENLSSDLLGPDGVPVAEDRFTFLTVDENKLASWFGRANIDLFDRFVVNASIRADGSSRFGEDNRWATFPAFGGAWKIKSEPFTDDWDFLSDLKLRASWGVNGNQAFANYQQYFRYQYGDAQTRAQFGDRFVPTIRPSAADPNIKWEETTSTNIGLDWGFFDNRLWGSLEFYWKSTDDLIFTVPIAAGTNFANQLTTNIGSMSNDGIELSVNALVAGGEGDGFSWDLGFNIAHQSNELTEINPFGGGNEIFVGGIDGGVGNTVQILIPGSEINSFYVYEHIMEGGKPVYSDRNGDGNITNEDLYVDQNGDGIVNQNDFVVFNSPQPDWLMGLTSLMRWNRFDLSFTLSAQIGNYVYNNVASNRGFYDNLRDSEAPNNLHRSVLETEFQSPQYFSDYYVEDASFLRLNNVQLGYTFRNLFNGLRVYAVAQNLFTITGYSGIDPTAGINGIDNNIYPRAQTFTAGVEVGF